MTNASYTYFITSTPFLVNGRVALNRPLSPICYSILLGSIVIPVSGVRVNA